MYIYVVKAAIKIKYTRHVVFDSCFIDQYYSYHDVQSYMFKTYGYKNVQKIYTIGVYISSVNVSANNRLTHRS